MYLCRPHRVNTDLITSDLLNSLKAWKFSTFYVLRYQIPVAVHSKAWVCGRLPAGITGSNPTGDMDFSVLPLSCVVR